MPRAWEQPGPSFERLQFVRSNEKLYRVNRQRVKRNRNAAT